MLRYVQQLIYHLTNLAAAQNHAASGVELQIMIRTSERGVISVRLTVAWLLVPV